MHAGLPAADRRERHRPRQRPLQPAGPRHGWGLHHLRPVPVRRQRCGRHRLLPRRRRHQPDPGRRARGQPRLRPAQRRARHRRRHPRRRAGRVRQLLRRRRRPRRRLPGRAALALDGDRRGRTERHHPAWTGSGTTGYCYLASTTPPIPPANPNKPGTTLNGGTGTLRASTLAASWRQVNIQVTPAPSPRVIVQVRYHPASPATRGSPSWTCQHQPGCRATYKFGLSASTGGSNDVHLIRNALVQSINPLSNLQLEKQVDRTAGNLPAGHHRRHRHPVPVHGHQRRPRDALGAGDHRQQDHRPDHLRPHHPAAGPGARVHHRVPRHLHRDRGRRRRAGQVVNTATATALDPGNATVTSPPSTVTVPLVSRLALTKAVQTPPPYVAGPAGPVRLHRHQHRRIDLDQRRGHRQPHPLGQARLPGQRARARRRDHLHRHLHRQHQPRQRRRPHRQHRPSRPAPPRSARPSQSPPAQAAIAVNTDIGVTKTVNDPTPDVGAHRHVHRDRDQQRACGRDERRDHRPAPRRPADPADLEHVRPPTLDLHRRARAPGPSRPSPSGTPSR